MKQITFLSMNPMYGKERESFLDQPCITMQNFLKNANATKRERELKAADRIFNILPEDQAKKLRGLWDEFEEYQTPEAKFAHVMDNLAPVMLSDAVGGKSWKEHGVFENQVYGRNKRTPEGSETLYQVIDEVFRKNIQLGNIKGDNK